MTVIRASDEIQVGIADDSAGVRRVLRMTLERSGHTVSFAARDGIEAVESFDRLRPDAVLLDISMPRLDGVGALVEIRKRCTRTPVIMFSGLARRGAAAVMQALAFGANDYVIKPQASGIEEAAAELARDLTPRIEALVGRARQGHARHRSFTTLPANTDKRDGVGIVVVGASTGGPRALVSFLKEFPADFPLPILVVQHMPPVFTEALSEQLDGQVALSVREARDGDAVAGGGVWIAPGDHHMGLAAGGGEIVLTEEVPSYVSRPSVDYLFRSAVEQYWSGTLGVVLTGMGVDGLQGSRDIVNAGGSVAIQDEASSPVWGMPGAVAQASLAAHVAAPAELARIVVAEAVGALGRAQ